MHTYVSYTCTVCMNVCMSRYVRLGRRIYVFTCVRMHVYSHAHALAHPLTHSYIHSPTHSFSHSHTHAFAHPLTLSHMNSVTHALTNLLTLLLSHTLTHSHTHALAHALTHLYIYSLTHNRIGWTCRRPLALDRYIHCHIRWLHGSASCSILGKPLMNRRLWSAHE